ncbi:MAG: N-acetylmuramoyl-L-alanine amidase [Phycisphaerae bacterium]
MKQRDDSLHGDADAARDAPLPPPPSPHHSPALPKWLAVVEAGLAALGRFMQSPVGTHFVAFVGGVLLVWMLSGSREKIIVVDGAREIPDPIATPALRYDWQDAGTPLFPIPVYAQFLKDARIVIDPGHGGRGDSPDFKRGPTGLREAEVNLSVSLFLQEFLESVGARVIMTRTRDVYLDRNNNEDLRLRAARANRANADLLISVHHNAAGSAEPNYSLIFYHQNGADSPASLCAARHLLTGLNDSMRLEQQVECAIRSDTTLYDSGLAILRHATVPAVLTESSFFSNPEEESRLRDPVYNRREAYGLFLGLARWAQAGLPRIKQVDAPRDVKSGSDVAWIELYDGLTGRGVGGPAMETIRWDTVRVRRNGAWVSVGMDPSKKLISVAANRGDQLFVDFQNVFGQHVIHPHVTVR